MTLLTNLRNKFLVGHERSVRAKKNVIYSFGIKGFSVLINLLLVPLTINYVNPTEYGIWLTLSSVITWFSFFDIGLGHGLRNNFAKAVTEGKVKVAKTLVSTTYAVLIIISCAIWLLFFIGNRFINWSTLLSTSASLSSQLTAVALIVFSFFCLQFILKIISIILAAQQQTAKAAIFDLFGQIGTITTIYFLTKFNSSGSLISLALASGIFQVLVLVVSSLWLYTHEFKIYSPRFSFVDFSYSKVLFGLGMKFFIIQISAIVVFESSNILISHITGPQNVTIYNVAYKYFFISTMITGIIFAPFWSAFTEAYVKGDYVWMKSVIKKLNYVWIAVTGLIIIMYFLSDFAYGIWIHNKVVIPHKVSFLIALNAIATTWFNLYVTVLNGTGKIKLQMLMYAIFSILFIPLAYFLGIHNGLPGIIMANLIVNLIFCIMTPIQSAKILSKSAVGIWNQ